MLAISLLLLIVVFVILLLVVKVLGWVLMTWLQIFAIVAVVIVIDVAFICIINMVRSKRRR